MNVYDLTHLSGGALDRSFDASVARGHRATADVLAHVAEYDARKRYLAAGYPTMEEYCIRVRNFSVDGARKRIHAARAARRFPALFVAVAEGKLHLTAVRLLAPHLTPDNIDEMITAASHRTAAEIEQMLARRVVRLETLQETAGSPSHPAAFEDAALIVPPRAVRHDGDVALPRTQDFREHALPEHHSPDRGVGDERLELGLTKTRQDQAVLSPEPVAAAPKPEPCAWVAVEKRVQEKIEYARALLSHRMPMASASMVLERALDDLIAKEEMHKFAVTERPRPARGQSARARHIPAHVKRAVWKRDGGRCTFVGADGHRCGSRKFLEFDHVDPVARGGKATVDRVRLRCRAHNQYDAERVFGAGFMARKRAQARAGRAERARSAGAGPAERSQLARAHGSKPS